MHLPNIFQIRFNGPRSSELLLQIQLETRNKPGRPCEQLDADAFILFPSGASVVISLVFDFFIGPEFQVFYTQASLPRGAIIAWSGNASERIMQWLRGRLKRLYYIRQLMLQLLDLVGLH